MATMKKIIGLGVLVLVSAVALVYAADYVVLRVRAQTSAAYGSVQVRQYYAIQEKNGRTEYVFGSMQNQTCVNSLFSHHGLQPCWYLRRHPEQRVQI